MMAPRYARGGGIVAVAGLAPPPFPPGAIVGEGLRREPGRKGNRAVFQAIPSADLPTEATLLIGHQDAFQERFRFPIRDRQNREDEG